MTAPVPGPVCRPLPLWERLADLAVVRRGIILVLIAAAWEIYARVLDSPLLLPSFAATVAALWDNVVNGVLPGRCLTSLRVLLLGYGAGVAIATVLTMLAVTTRAAADLLATLIAMFNPLPAIALLPLALLWFGLGDASMVFILIHAVLWPVSLNTLAGFMGVSDTLRMVGLNCGLRGLGFAARILIPAAFPSILSGLKIGWAFGWRTLIAAELVFGVSSESGGLGWFIYQNRSQLETANVFAGLLTVILIGLLVEVVVFRTVELRTVRRWGMQR